RLGNGQKPLTNKTRAMAELIDDTIHSVRRIATGLRPEVLDAVGLTAAIAWQARDFQKRTGIRCAASLPAEGSIEPRPDLATAVFRIFQEVLTNVARHANATRVDVSLLEDGDVITLEVHDNGRGIELVEVENMRSLGLLGMRERALQFDGKVEIS